MRTLSPLSYLKLKLQEAKLVRTLGVVSLLTYTVYMEAKASYMPSDVQKGSRTIGPEGV